MTGEALVRQRGRSDCGPAALATAARLLGRPLSLAEAAALAAPGADGTSLAALAAAARRIGLDARPVHTTGSPARLHAPALVHRRRHWIVLAGATPAGLVVLDPSRGRRVLSARRLRWGASGYALELRA